MKRIRTSFPARRIATTLLILPLSLLLNTGCLLDLFSSQEGGSSNLPLLVALILLSQTEESDSCEGVVSPNANSATASNPTASSYSAITGKFHTQAGAGVTGALVMLDNLTSGDNIHYSTHASINRDGSFTIAGVPAGSYRMAIEPLNTSSFGGRIDTHLNCYNSPSSFTQGWWNGSGDTITTSTPGSLGITLSSASTLDVGTLKLLE